MMSDTPQNKLCELYVMYMYNLEDNTNVWQICKTFCHFSLKGSEHFQICLYFRKKLIMMYLYFCEQQVNGWQKNDSNIDISVFLTINDYF